MLDTCTVGDALKYGSDALEEDEVLTIGIRSPQNLNPSADSNVWCAINLKAQPANEPDSGTNSSWLKSLSANL